MEDFRSKYQELYKRFQMISESMNENMTDLSKLEKERQTVQDELQNAHEYTANIIDTVREALIVLDEDMRVITANSSFYKIFNSKYEDTIGHYFYNLGNHQWDIPELRELLEEIIPRDEIFNDFEVRRDFSGIGEKIMQLNARRMSYGLEKRGRILLAIEDVTERRKAEIELERKAAELEATFNSISDIAIIYDNDGYIVRINRQGQKMLGFTEKDYRKTIEERWEKFICVEDGMAFSLQDIPIVRAMQGKIVSGDIVALSLESRKVYVTAHCKAIFTPEGKSIGYIATFTDVTNIKLAEVRANQLKNELHIKKQELEATLNSMAEGLIIYDTEGNIKEINKKARELLRYTIEEVKKPINERTKAFFSLRRPDGIEYETHNIPGVRSLRGEIVQGEEMTIFYRDNTITTVLISSAPLRDDTGAITGTVTNISDITRLKQIENELRAAKHELEDYSQDLEHEVSDRTDQLKTLNEELESVTFNVAHDLRTPLINIKTVASMLSDEYEKYLDQDARDFLSSISTTAGNLHRMINAILNLLKITRGDIIKEQVNLSRIAEEIIKEYRDRYPEDKFASFIQPDITAYGSPILLKIVMQNLLENAIIYSRSKQNRRIEFGSKIVNREQVFFVQDNGIGFAMYSSERIFRPFYRLEKGHEGMGIGLAAVKHIILRHGGRVCAESEPGQGATFYFTLG